MNLREHITLAPLTTFHIGGSARYFLPAANDDEVREGILFAKDKKLPFVIIGSGSNLLVSDNGFNGVVIQVSGKNISTVERDHATELIADAGVVWDELVERSVASGLWGLANLSSIPGKVGGSVVQNIGAYGVEVSSFVEWVEVYDPALDAIRRLSISECKFGYRESIFKTPEGKHLVVLRVAYTLRHEGAPDLNYKDLTAYDQEVRKIITLRDLREAIIYIREKKFPDLQHVGTAGSFFKNPVVEKTIAEVFLRNYPDAPSWAQSDGRVKLSSAWIIDHVLKIKGERHGDVGSWGAQALVLVNYGHATAYDVAHYAKVIIEKCFTATGIQLEPEVVYIGDVISQ